MSIETLRKWMAEPEKDLKKWELCAALAEEVFAASEPADRAYAAYARCRSLSNLGRMTLALEPGQTACVLAEQVGDYELLGRALLEVAFIQSRTPGHGVHAIGTYTRFLGYRERYSDSLQANIPGVWFNLGVVEKACGKHREALEHFRQATEMARSARDSRMADYFRRNLCWQAMHLGDLQMAKELILLGEQYLQQLQREEKRRPTNGEVGDAMNRQIILAETHLLNEKARYHLLIADYPTAAALALDVIAKSQEHPDAGRLAEALITLSQACEKTGDIDAALSIGMWAHLEAQNSERPELVTEVRRQVQGIRLQDREVVDRVMAGVLRP